MRIGVAAIVLAGGAGERSGRTGGKQLARVAGRPIVAWSLSALAQAGLSHIVLVCPAEQSDAYVSEVLGPLGLTTPVTLAAAGVTRHESVVSGMSALPSDTDIVVIHDGARPLVSPSVAAAAIDLLLDSPDAAGVVVGHPSVDTLKRVADGAIVETVDREHVWSAQTPQVFRVAQLREAHRAASADRPGTDDAMLVERDGGTVLMLEGPRDNIKVTLPEDFAFVESVLARRAEGE